MVRLALCVMTAVLLSGLSACHAPMPMAAPLAGVTSAALRTPVRAGYATISVQELHAMPAATRAKLIDVREPDEYAAGHVPGAVNVPLGTVATWATSQPTDTPLLVICHSGRRSAMASQTLVDKGFGHITNVAGGTAAWIQAGYPVDTRLRR